MDEETADLIRDMRDLIEDAHDTHIFAEGDPHPADCPYCKMTKWANAVLDKHGKGLA